MNDNERFGFIQLAATTANVTRYLEKKQIRESHQSNGHTRQDSNRDHNAPGAELAIEVG